LPPELLVEAAHIKALRISDRSSLMTFALMWKIDASSSVKRFMPFARDSASNSLFLRKQSHGNLRSQ
jgi:hypothetical protein